MSLDEGSDRLVRAEVTPARGSCSRAEGGLRGGREGATDGYCFVFGQEPVGGDEAIASDLHLGRRTCAQVANPVDMGAPPRSR